MSVYTIPNCENKLSACLSNLLSNCNWDVHRAVPWTPACVELSCRNRMQKWIRMSIPWNSGVPHWLNHKHVRYTQSSCAMWMKLKWKVQHCEKILRVTELVNTQLSKVPRQEQGCCLCWERIAAHLVLQKQYSVPCTKWLFTNDELMLLFCECQRHLKRTSRRFVHNLFRAGSCAASVVVIVTTCEATYVAVLRAHWVPITATMWCPSMVTSAHHVTVAKRSHTFSLSVGAPVVSEHHPSQQWFVRMESFCTCAQHKCFWRTQD